ncbi:hypothetical protein SHLA_15c000980 [Shinella sp. DD12]|nr:hypothetical protein SHLA_15c000980 [Shinella sp. DD12]
MILVSRNYGNFCLTSCSKEGQPRTRSGAFALDSTSAESKGPLEGPAVCDRPFLRQDEHGVSNVFDLHRAGHTRKQNGKSTVPSYRKHFVFPCLSGAMNADRVRVVPCHFDEISMRCAA